VDGLVPYSPRARQVIDGVRLLLRERRKEVRGDGVR
jgi:hypothetical protein